MHVISTLRTQHSDLEGWNRQYQKSGITLGQLVHVHPTSRRVLGRKEPSAHRGEPLLVQCTSSHRTFVLVQVLVHEVISADRPVPGAMKRRPLTLIFPSRWISSLVVRDWYWHPNRHRRNLKLFRNAHQHLNCPQTREVVIPWARPCIVHLCNKKPIRSSTGNCQKEKMMRVSHGRVTYRSPQVGHSTPECPGAASRHLPPDCWHEAGALLTAAPAAPAALTTHFGRRLCCCLRNPPSCLGGHRH